MKLSLRIICLFVLFHFSGMGSASNNNFLNTNLVKTVVIDNSWTLIKTENGINVYYSTYEEVSGELGLKIKFENTLNQDIKTYWSLQKDDNYIFEKVVLHINASSIYQFDHTAIMIPFGQNDLLNDFKITFFQK